ncbi:MAG TPA: hypothetical protein PLP19_12050 [bacterium]|nr:hypothetical protein [bacterium]HPN44215.1 hypothetical protein [bacterium]
MKKYILIVILLIINSGILFARNGDGGYAGAFLRMGMGARAKAMGDAFTAIPEGAIAGFYNPALLPHLQERQVVASYSFLPLDRSLDYVGFAMPLHPAAKEGKRGNPLKAGVALGWVHAGTDKIYGTNSNGQFIGDLSNSEHAFYLSFAIRPADKLSIGVSGKVLYNRMPGLQTDNSALTSTGFGMDFGIFLTPRKNVMLGFVVRDNMSKYTWNTDKVFERGTSTVYKFPKVTRAAIAYRIPQEWLLLAFEAETSDKQNPRYHYGMEFTYKPVGAIQLGLDDNMPTFGLGLKFNVLSKTTLINYAFVVNDVTPGSDHIFTWAFNF